MSSFGIVIGQRPTSIPSHLSYRGMVRGALDGPNSSTRRQRDIEDNFYPTPPEATRALLSVECFEGDIWEPACGQGHIAEVLKSAGHRVVATDLNDRGYGVAGIDFLGQTQPLARHIVTNPPYGSGLADAFISKALGFARRTRGTVAMLLNLASLAEPMRTPFWRHQPPARIYAIDSVLCWPEPNRRPPAHFTRHRYCWAVWTPDHRGPAAFWWLSAAEFRNPTSRSNPNERKSS